MKLRFLLLKISGTNIRATKLEVKIIEAKLGGKELLNNFIKKYISNYGTEGLSKQQVNYLSPFNDLDSLRAKVLKEYEQEARRNIEQTLPIKFLKDKNERIYGFYDPQQNQIYLTEELLNSNTLVHEMAHW